MKKVNDGEFFSADEYAFPPEEKKYPPEDTLNAEEFPPPETTSKAPEEEKDSHKRLKMMLLLPIVTSLAALTVFSASLGFDFLAGTSPVLPSLTSAESDSTAAPPSTTNTAVSETETTDTDAETTTETDAPDESGEHGDSAFPILANLEPNGYINDDFGVLDEEYICLMMDGKYHYLVFHEKEGYTYYDPNGEVIVPSNLSNGYSYSKDTNTLYLENCAGGVIVANIMGNGFKIHVTGDCYLDGLHVYGFFYGGSATITGDGSLTVNRNSENPYGILLECEQSPSCLMIDNTVTLDVYGNTSAVFVNASTLDKGIYYLLPSSLSGGVRTEGIETDADGVFDYHITDPETGEYSKHVIFTPKG